MANRLKPLSLQTLVITGGSSGIGLSTALRAAKAGAKVVLVSRDAETLAEACERIRRQGGRADYVVGDVGIRGDMRNVVDTVVARHGGFDTWVNNAGVGIYALLEEITDEDHQRIFQTNYWGVVYGSLEALKHLKPKGGAIINIGSVNSDMAVPLLSAYSASKHAIRGFTDALRLELMQEDVPVSITLIKPSGIHTPFGNHAKNYMDSASQVPPPVYHPDLVAEAVLHAAAHPMRDVTIGGSGKLLVWFSYVAPELSDRVFSKVFFHVARNEDREKRPGSALFHPGGGTHQLGDQNSHIRKHSLFTRARLHSATALGVFTGVATLLCLSRKRGKSWRI